MKMSASATDLDNNISNPVDLEATFHGFFEETFETVTVFPIGSMYGIYPYIYHKNQPNVGKYTIHGSSGFDFLKSGDVLQVFIMQNSVLSSSIIRILVICRDVSIHLYSSVMSPAVFLFPKNPGLDRDLDEARSHAEVDGLLTG